MPRADSKPQAYTESTRESTQDSKDCARGGSDNGESTSLEPMPDSKPAFNLASMQDLGTHTSLESAPTPQPLRDCGNTPQSAGSSLSNGSAESKPLDLPLDSKHDNAHQPSTPLDSPPTLALESSQNFHAKAPSAPHSPTQDLKQEAQARHDSINSKTAQGARQSFMPRNSIAQDSTPQASMPHDSTPSHPQSTESAKDSTPNTAISAQEQERAREFLLLFTTALRAHSGKAELDSLMSELAALPRAQLLALRDEAQSAALMSELATLLRDRIYTLFTQGAVCDVKYFALFSLLDCAQVGEDTRFSVFENMARAALYKAPQSMPQNTTPQYPTRESAHIDSTSQDFASQSHAPHTQESAHAIESSAPSTQLLAPHDEAHDSTSQNITPHDSTSQNPSRPHATKHATSKPTQDSKHLPHSQSLAQDSATPHAPHAPEPLPHFTSENDSETLLFIELYLLSKALRSFCDYDGLMREYVRLISLTDINLPAALTHTSFLVESCPALTMANLLHALRPLLKSYCAYPPMRRRSILNWQLHCFWNMPHIFNHHAWLELYPLWREAFYTALECASVEGIDEAMYLQFFIYHFCGNNFHHQAQWRQFCEEIDKVGARAYEGFAKANGIYGSKPPDSKRAKKCIGILRDRLVANSPFKVEFSLLANLLANEDFTREYEVKIYCMKLLEKSSDDERIIAQYRALGVEVVDVVSCFNTRGFYNSHLQKALAIKEALNRDEVSILISPNNGYGISDFILASRSAPLQVFYSHGNFVYDLPCLDVKMTHICQNKPRITHEGYEFVGVSVKMQERFYNPPLDEGTRAEVARLRASFGANALIIGTIGRLSKISAREYWQCVIESMRPYPQSAYVACGGGNYALIEEVILSCFDDEEEGRAFLARVHFMGYVDSALYGHIIDVWLDSFPHEQGESRLEYLAKGGLSLMMSKCDEATRAEHIAQWVAQWAQLCPSQAESSGDSSGDLSVDSKGCEGFSGGAKSCVESKADSQESVESHAPDFTHHYPHSHSLHSPARGAHLHNVDSGVESSEDSHSAKSRAKSPQERESYARQLLTQEHLPLVAFSREDYIAKAHTLLGLFARGEAEQIAKIRAIVAQGRAISDELREASGVRAFKEAIGAAEAVESEGVRS